MGVKSWDEDGVVTVYVLNGQELPKKGLGKVRGRALRASPSTQSSLCAGLFAPFIENKGRRPKNVCVQYTCAR